MAEEGSGSVKRIKCGGKYYYHNRKRQQRKFFEYKTFPDLTLEYTTTHLKNFQNSYFLLDLLSLILEYFPNIL